MSHRAVFLDSLRCRYTSLLGASGEEPDALDRAVRTALMSRPGSKNAASLILEWIVMTGKERSRGANRWMPEAVGGSNQDLLLAMAVSIWAFEYGLFMNAYMIRSAIKDHGTQVKIEGPAVSDRPVLVALTSIGSGHKARELIELLRQARATVLGVAAVIDREEGGLTAIVRAGLPAMALFTATEIRDPSKK